MIDNIYGAYKDNECLFIGTKKQLEEQFDIKIKTLQYITDPNNKLKRHKGKRIRLVLTK